MNIVLNPVPVTVDIMKMLEAKKVITRICPGHDILHVEAGESRHETVYAADEKFGPHKLICVTINNTQATNFLYHNDAEDFMLIDLPDRTELIITMSLLAKDELEIKIKNRTFTSKDMIAVIFKPNDPYTSFFTMNKHFAHVETCSRESNTPPSFYVAESKKLDENIIDLDGYKLQIER